MKNYMLLIALFPITLFTAFCPVHAQIKVGIRTGVNLTSANLESRDGEKYTTGSIPRFQIGLTVDIPLAGDFYLQPAALYSGKGFKQHDSWFAGANNEFKVRVSYIEVPLNFLYKPRLGTGRLLLGLGPYVAYGTGGRWKSDSDVAIGDILIENYGDVIFRDDIVDGEWGNYLYGRPWDYGAGIMVGYEFLDRFSVQLNGQFGIANLHPKVDGADLGGKIKNNGYGISVGFNF